MSRRTTETKNQIVKVLSVTLLSLYGLCLGIDILKATRPKGGSLLEIWTEVKSGMFFFLGKHRTTLDGQHILESTEHIGLPLVLVLPTL